MLYPPYIEGTIPSFYGDSLTVPFSMNKGVGAGEVKGFSLKIKTIQNTKYLFTTTTENYDVTSEYYAKFKISLTDQYRLKVGQHYKIQIAYIDVNGTVGYYSTVGIVKYTTRPKVIIKDLKAGKVNSSSYNYIGEYSQNGGDSTEKEYKYNFTFTDSANNILKDSGWLIHNSSNDNSSNKTHDEFFIPFDLEKNKSYYIQYKVITNNKMEVKSPKYRVSQQQAIDLDADLSLHAEMNNNNGYVTLTMTGEYDEYENEIPFSGGFLITRSCIDTDFKNWDEILRFQSKNSYASKWEWKDFTVEQGKEYKYAIQQYNDFDIYTDRVYSNIVFSDFEDLFLYDGKRQLKVSYNPKVSSFKADVLESKTDTIGGKYPFIFRNGNVNYKEFSISGLISYLSDEEHLFMTNEEIGLNPQVEKLKRSSTVIAGLEPDDQYYFDRQYSGIDIYNLKKNYEEVAEVNELMSSSKIRTTDLVGYNYAAERTFKLKVLEWLNNGEPKLFRSPGEGNYLVRLMNISLSPEETVGRLLHNFSCTAYEIDNYDFEALNTYGIVSNEIPVIKTLRFKSVKITGITENLLGKDDALHIQLSGMRPGDMVEIEADGGNQTIIIGTTGIYQLEDDTKISSVRLSEDTAKRYQNQTLNSPILTYGYYENAINAFNSITNITFNDYPMKQYIGEQENIVKQINNVKDTLVSFYYLHFIKRDVENYNDFIDFHFSANEQEYLYTIKNTDTVLNYFPIYRFTVPKLNNTNCWGFQQVDLKEEDFRLAKKDFKDPNANYVKLYDKYNYRYYIKKDGEYEPTFTWDPTATYFKKRDFILYKDLRFDITYVDKKCWDQLVEELTPQQLEEYALYENSFSIDYNIVDINETNDYSIEGPIQFDLIELNAGVILECGYSYRTITYNVENLNQDLIDKKQEVNDSYNAIKNQINSDDENTLKIYLKYQDYLKVRNDYNKLLEILKEE